MHPWFTNVIRNVLLISVDKVFYGNAFMGNDQKGMPQPVQVESIDERLLCRSSRNLVIWWRTHLWGRCFLRNCVYCWTGKGYFLNLRRKVVAWRVRLQGMWGLCLSASKRQIWFERWGVIDGGCFGVPEPCEKPKVKTVPEQLWAPRDLPPEQKFR